ETTPVWWNNRYRIKSLRELEQDLDWLLRLAPPVSLQDLLDWQAGRRDRPRGWFLSFDDGYRELADEIAPLLKRKGIPATFFLCSSLIDNRSVFFEDHAGWIAHVMQSAAPAARRAVADILNNAGTSLELLLKSRVPQPLLLHSLSEVLNLDIDAWLKTEQPYVTSTQVRQLLHDGFTIGAHSVNHPLFSDIPLDEGVRQIRESLQELDAGFGLSARVFAFPYGEFGLSATALQQLLQLSNAQMLFGTRGIVRDEHEPQLIQRLLAEDHPFSFQQHLCSELNLQLQRQFTGRPTVRRSLVSR
ncbi:MAG: polysaccharide deacetylase family protein, partial [Planctomycetaceae bacterium]